MAEDERTVSSVEDSIREKEAEENTLSTEIEGLALVLDKLRQNGASPREQLAVEKQIARLCAERKDKLREIEELRLKGKTP